MNMQQKGCQIPLYFVEIDNKPSKNAARVVAGH